MKALFESHFPFVKDREAELTPEQTIVKQTYDKLYPTGVVPVGTVFTKESGSDSKAEVKRSGLREVHANEAGTRDRSDR